MTYQMSDQAQSLLIVQEGYRQFPYFDTRGKQTIGIGRNLADVGLSRSEALYLMQNDISKAGDFLARNLTWWSKLDKTRQDVLVNLTFNMGPKILGFKNMLAALQVQDWKTAGDELVNSAADHQEPARIEALANILKTGVYNGPGGTVKPTS